jgi:hypothetical protein
VLVDDMSMDLIFKVYWNQSNRFNLIFTCGFLRVQISDIRITFLCDDQSAWMYTSRNRVTQHQQCFTQSYTAQ